MESKPRPGSCNWGNVKPTWMWLIDIKHFLIKHSPLPTTFCSGKCYTCWRAIMQHATLVERDWKIGSKVAVRWSNSTMQTTRNREKLDNQPTRYQWMGGWNAMCHGNKAKHSKTTTCKEKWKWVWWKTGVSSGQRIKLVLLYMKWYWSQVGTIIMSMVLRKISGVSG